MQASRAVEQRIIRQLLRRQPAVSGRAAARCLIAMAASASALLALLIWPPELLWAALASALVVSLGLQ
jgi:hypothetical protein